MTRFTAVSRVNEERLAANAREAAEQCERLTVPVVRETVSFGRLLDDWPVERRLLVCAEWGEARPIAEALQAIRAGSPGDAGPWADSSERRCVGEESVSTVRYWWWP